MSLEEPVEPDPEVLAEPVALDSDHDEEAGPVPDALPTVAIPAVPPSAERSLVRADPFRRYLAEIRKYPGLDRGEEQELAKRYRESGDRDALFRLITANLMMVVRVALSFRRAARNLLDLVQEGNVGLLQAIERFDPEVGVRLPTYATWWVRAYMVKYLLDNVRLVRVGTTNARRRLLYNLRQEQRRLEEQGFDVGPRLLAQRFGVSEEDVKDVHNALTSQDVSLDAPVGEDEDRSRGDQMAAEGPTVEEEVARRELQERALASIGRFRKGLKDRDRMILEDRILSDDPLTLQALGDRFGTTREAVRQAETRLKTRLHDHLRRELGHLDSIHIGPK